MYAVCVDLVEGRVREELCEADSFSTNMHLCCVQRCASCFGPCLPFSPTIPVPTR